MYSLYNIEQWTTAIYAKKFPEAIPHLAKHAEIVREMVTPQNSNAWFVYDQRVRMDRQARGLLWEDFNIEVYIMATRARDRNFSGTFVTRDPEVDIPEDYAGPLTGMDFAKCPTADSLTNVQCG